ncbi:MAG: heme exporter protein CcmB [Ferruginibacter sp.]
MNKAVWTLIRKDVLLELRQKHTLYGILLYLSSTIFILFLSLPDAPSYQTWNALFWMMQLFVCVNAVAKSFLQESKARLLYFQTLVSPASFLLAKLVYNMLLMMILSVCTYFIFGLFLDDPTQRPGLFLGIAMLGGVGISMVFTLMSAIASKAQQSAALMAILGFPVILPQLLLIMRLSKAAFGEVFRENALIQLAALTAGMDLLVVILAIILFPYLWKD